MARLPASKFFCRALIAQQFAESLHLAPAAVREKAVVVGVPLFEVAKTNPMAIAPVHADLDDAPAWTIVIAAFVILHEQCKGAVFLASCLRSRR